MAYTEEEDDVIGQYLFDNKLIEQTKRTLHTVWKIREKKMKEKEDSGGDSHAVKTVETLKRHNHALKTGKRSQTMKTEKRSTHRKIMK